MRISLQSTINKPNPGLNKSKAVHTPELKTMFENILKQKNEYDQAKVNWVDDQSVELKNVSNQCLHSFLLEAEKQGKDISFTKQTVITIS